MLNIDHLNFNYPGRKALFTDLNLNLSPGHIYGLLGNNGAGKSTLLKLLAGLVFPKKGSCEVWNYQPKKREPAFLRNIYFISEDLYIPRFNVIAVS